MSLPPTYAKFISELQNARIEWHKDLRERWNFEISDLRETLRNLSVVVGATGTGALIVLSAPFRQVEALVVFGASTLMITGAASLSFLLFSHHEGLRAVLKHKQRYVNPMDLVLLIGDNVQSGSGKVAELDAEITKFENQFREEYRNGRNPTLSDREFTIKFPWYLFAILLVVGVVSVIAGLLIPYLTCL